MTGNHDTVSYCIVKWLFVLPANPAVTEASQLVSVPVVHFCTTTSELTDE
jgi:hypothetical protein